MKSYDFFKLASSSIPGLWHRTDQGDTIIHHFTLKTDTKEAPIEIRVGQTKTEYVFVATGEGYLLEGDLIARLKEFFAT